VASSKLNAYSIIAHAFLGVIIIYSFSWTCLYVSFFLVAVLKFRQLPYFIS